MPCNQCSVSYIYISIVMISIVMHIMSFSLTGHKSRGVLNLEDVSFLLHVESLHKLCNVLFPIACYNFRHYGRMTNSREELSVSVH